MATKTQELEDMTLEMGPSATTAQLLAQVAKAQGWPGVESLLRLEGEGLTARAAHCSGLAALCSAADDGAPRGGRV